MQVNEAGVIDWAISLDDAGSRLRASAIDQAGNQELTPHEIETGRGASSSQVAAK